MLHNGYYTVNRHKYVLIIRYLYINKTPFFIGFSLITFSGFESLKRGFEDNIRMKKILDEQLESKKQKYTGLELKHHKKGIYRKFPLYS